MVFAVLEGNATMVSCKECNATIPQTSIFCKKCGARTQAYQQNAYPNNQAHVMAAASSQPNQNTATTFASISREDLAQARHRAEKPLFIVSCIISAMLLFALQIITILYMLGMLIYDLCRSLAQARVRSIRVSEKNFPEIYNKSVEYAQMLGFEKVPPVFIRQGHGVINAFASAIFGTKYSILHSELVDVAYIHKDFDTVNFILAHEFAHIYLKHTTLYGFLLRMLTLLVPIYGTMFSRSQEYSCDRIAQVLTGNVGAREMMLLVAGRHLYRHVDIDDYIATAHNESGILTFWMNLLATHPIPKKRIDALLDPAKKSGKLF